MTHVLGRHQPRTPNERPKFTTRSTLRHLAIHFRTDLRTHRRRTIPLSRRSQLRWWQRQNAMRG
jgi:hypothetical protein